MGRERGRVLAVAATDPVMSVVAPVALAASAGTALVVDMGETLGRAGARTLEDIAADGPTRAEAVPGRKGVDVIRSGRLRTEDAVALVGRLALAWPAGVIRAGTAGWLWPPPHGGCGGAGGEARTGLAGGGHPDGPRRLAGADGADRGPLSRAALSPRVASSGLATGAGWPFGRPGPGAGASAGRGRQRS